jgi:hypothetical protein
MAASTRLADPDFVLPFDSVFDLVAFIGTVASSSKWSASVPGNRSNPPVGSPVGALGRIGPFGRVDQGHWATAM